MAIVKASQFEEKTILYLYLLTLLFHSSHTYF